MIKFYLIVTMSMLLVSAVFANAYKLGLQIKTETVRRALVSELKGDT